MAAVVARLPLQFCQCLADDASSLLDVFVAVSGRNECGLELRRRKINAALETGMKKLREFLGVATLSGFQIEDWTAGEKEAKHRTDAVKCESLP
jgi:hypothetical protein